MADRTPLDGTFYERAAGLYDLVATAPGVRSWRVRAVDALDLSPGDTVVEMGCGTGANIPYLREQVGTEGRVIGVDLAGAMLRQAQARTERAGWENVSVVRGDATTPPVGTADALLATFVVGMLEDSTEAVETWLQCVGAGGRLALLNAGRSPRPAAMPLNLCLRLFVRLAAPGNRLRRRSPLRALEERWRRAREALFSETVDHREQRLGAGLVSLVSGRVPE
ncbi:Ubiquinone/menaquinone biosynthesis C-methylase UbiE [Halovenus aranensis]|jgi:ubiquinone/menaquinone biosynthesis C-methylase UbiE|uniref:Ubiquinone/menaquinone biosynthesis C-methylase UbiE n=1 Tax=Halovenus aranensis TaxID=890420 RepID=A0A1G8Y1H9_9EURY|nr:methyltransferase domain-containing protein [Halovenus aranensis]SDJ96304.1 Ubiquinone/menaquinone biosynthesis C-methylase UbiE [Halovenus aranensis]